MTKQNRSPAAVAGNGHAELGLLRDDGTGRHRFLSSGDIEQFRRLGGRLLGPELASTERWPLTSRSITGDIHATS